jgi:hypothetical protein
MLHHYRIHVENDLVEFVTVDDQEYEEAILVPEEFLEPPMTDTTDAAPAQGKPRCITRIFNNHYIYREIPFYTRV